MNQRIILVTGANGGLGQAIAKSFLNERAENFVWLGVRSRRENAEKLECEFPERCHCVDLESRNPIRGNPPSKKFNPTIPASTFS